MIPVSRPVLGKEEIELVSASIADGWISSRGPMVERFEQGWAEYCGRAHGVAVSSGTAALHVALAAVGVGPGDEVILPAFTMASCAFAVLYCGAQPVLADVDPGTWTISVDQVRSRIGPRTVAVIAVDMYGHPAAMDPLRALCDKKGLVLIEDAAEAHGAEYRSQGEWRRCGSFGALSCFSFYANKIVTTGEGGMVVTDDSALAEKMRSLRNLAFDDGRRFEHSEVGFNYRMSSLLAALGVAQLGRVDDLVKAKRRIAVEYQARLASVHHVVPASEASWARSVFWMFGVLVDPGTALSTDELAAKLFDIGVETRPFFVGMHRQSALTDRGLFRGERYAVTDYLSNRGLYLPSAADLTEEEMSAVCVALESALP